MFFKILELAQHLLHVAVDVLFEGVLAHIITLINTLYFMTSEKLNWFGLHLI